MDRPPTKIYRLPQRVAGSFIPSRLADCVDSSAKIATGLVRYKAKSAIGQLRQFKRAVTAVDQAQTAQQRLTIGALIWVSIELNDARMPLAVSRATAGCGVLAQGAAR